MLELRDVTATGISESYLFVDLLHELHLLLQGLSAVLGVQVGQGLIVQVLKNKTISFIIIQGFKFLFSSSSLIELIFFKRLKREHSNMLIPFFLSVCFLLGRR